MALAKCFKKHLVIYVHRYTSNRVNFLLRFIRSRAIKMCTDNKKKCIDTV